MNVWPIRPGASIGIMSSARGITLEEVETSRQCLQDWGYRVLQGNTIGVFDHQFAGSDHLRATNLSDFLQNPNIQAILFGRGGYGTMRTLEHIDPEIWQQSACIPAGYSDITVIHAWLNTKLQKPSIHSAMSIGFPTATPETLASLRQCLAGNPPSYTWNHHPLNTTGSIQGRITGGNLSILYSMLGTPFDWDAGGWILFLEDVDEYLYHIDRMMTALRLAGKLNSLKGIVAGSFTAMHDNQRLFGETAEEIIARHAKIAGVPVCFGFPAGHTTDNRALLFGVPANLEISESESRLSWNI